VRHLTVEQWKAREALETLTVIRIVFDADTDPELYAKALDDLRALDFKGR
jgi:hypothetical protein